MRTKLILTILLIAVGWIYADCAAQDESEYLQLEIKFRESSPALNISAKTVLCDTVQIFKDIPLEAFVGNLSLFFDYNQQLDTVAEFEITQISLFPQSRSDYKRVLTPLGIPYIVNDVLSKGDYTYSVMFTPLKFGQASIDCDYNHRDPDQFYFDPSGSFDIYFIPNSLADIYWNNVRDYLEMELKNFNKIYSFSQPGKINYYLYPCQPNTYADYINGHYGIHPAKNAIYHEYSHRTAGIPTVAVNLLKLYRYWGYAPHILAEGIANLNEFYGFYCQEFKKSEGLYPLRHMLVSMDYDNQPNTFKKQMQAAALAGYLISVYGKDRVRELYNNSTDLSLENQLTKLTGLSINDLDAEVVKYTDTLEYPLGLHHYYAQREMSQSNAAEAIFLYEKGVEKDPNDTTFYSYLFNAYYLVGDYDKAANIIRAMADYYPEKNYCLQLANMLFAGNQVDSAMHYYKIAESLNVDRELVSYKLAQLDYYVRDFENARRYFNFISDTAKSIPLQIDAHLYLGRLLLQEGNPDSAEVQFTMALNGSKKLLSTYPDNPLYNLRAGEAALMLKEYEAARLYLDKAEFIELRPIYLGRILLAKGMLYDATGDRERARTSYRRVLDNKSALIDKSMAETYLEQPFSN